MRQITAGIVTFNPDIGRLKENIDAIYDQVPTLVIVDNGSDNLQEISDLLKSYTNTYIEPLGENKGIAAAQNVMCRWAKENEYEWIITLDQDSVSPEGLVLEYERVIKSYDNIGIICPRVLDRNFGEINYGIEHNGIEEVPQCIASASAVNLAAWKAVGEFYEPLFIDAVDFDICWTLLENGYKILRTNNVNLLHEVGHSRKVYFAGKERLILNHSPLRYYYIIRNSFITGRRHKRLLRNLRACVRMVYQVNKYETNRHAKNKMLWLGFWDGLLGKCGKFNH